MVKKRKFETLESLLARLWCYYCEKDFDNDRELIDHQKSKHFQCASCKKRLQTANGLVVHVNNVHKLTVDKIENALPGRESTKVEIFGMMGIPDDLREEKRGEVIRKYEVFANEYRAKTGNPLPGSAEAEERALKAPRLKETKEERQARLREHIAQRKAMKEGKANAASPGNAADAMEPSTASPDNAATPQPAHDPFQPPGGIPDAAAPHFPPPQSTGLPAGFGQPPPFGLPQPPSGSPYASQSPFGQPNQYPPPGPYGFAGPHGAQNGFNGTHVSYSSPQPPISAPYSMPSQAAPSGYRSGSWDRPGSRGQDFSPFNSNSTKTNGSGPSGSAESRSNSLPSAPDLPQRPSVSMENISMEAMKALHPHSNTPQQDFRGAHYPPYHPAPAPVHNVVASDTYKDDIDRRIAELTGQGKADNDLMSQSSHYNGMQGVHPPAMVSNQTGVPSQVSHAAPNTQVVHGLPSRPSNAVAPQTPDASSNAVATVQAQQEPATASPKVDRIRERLDSRSGLKKDKHGKYSMMVYSSEVSPEEARYKSSSKAH